MFFATRPISMRDRRLYATGAVSPARRRPLRIAPILFGAFYFHRLIAPVQGLRAIRRDVGNREISRYYTRPHCIGRSSVKAAILLGAAINAQRGRFDLLVVLILHGGGMSAPQWPLYPICRYIDPYAYVSDIAGLWRPTERMWPQSSPEI